MAFGEKCHSRDIIKVDQNSYSDAQNLFQSANTKVKSYYFREFQNGDENILQRMIKDVFAEFVGVDYSSEGNEFFYSYISAEKIAERVSKGNLILCAVNDDEIVGMIEVRDSFHICLLFVLKDHHRKGLAKMLFESVLEKICQNDIVPEFIEVNASPYSVKIYKKLGFELTADQQESNGIKYYPMIYYL